MTTPLLQADFQLALEHFELNVKFESGPEMVVVFGPSGSGKSMTLRALAGLVRPEGGFIRLGERLLFHHDRGIHLSPQSRNVGYVPQQYALFPHMTIEENVVFGLHEFSRRDQELRAAELLTLMRLEPLAQRYPSEVSGGQQQRAALARALAREPRMLLMDEPFAALEEDLRAHLRDELVRIQERFNIPVLLVTHSLTEAYALAHQLVVLDSGRVVQSGERDQVFRLPKTSEVARLMGMSNILKAEVLRAGDDGILVDWKGMQLHVGGEFDGEPGDLITLGLRPEEIMVIRRGRPLPVDLRENRFQGLILEDYPQGFDHMVSLSCGPERTLTMRIPHPIFVKLDLKVGETRPLAVKSTSFHIFPKQ